ncbi:hypothetical protein SNE26_03090 [Mucilaginibacter sp. cycad4]|uniref:hypothetical protein n=1 Tax=Mucilaginibacter sp. cycad4 TaxID=3342096 RepID=UPI002AAB2B8C|nr:hypothetical protein [Mucilaginibacter gossypii]WPV00748.1 hypothetical protein SNE26_03090 [Mucilaginibacter gossypii]
MVYEENLPSFQNFVSLVGSYNQKAIRVKRMAFSIINFNLFAASTMPCCLDPLTTAAF